MKVDKIEEASESFEWIDVSTKEDSYTFGISGFFSLTARGRETWLIENFSRPFESPDKDLETFLNLNPSIKFSLNPENLSFQFVHLWLACSRANVALVRKDLNYWNAFMKFPEDSGDTIQLINKVNQWGLEDFRPRLGRVTYYFCPFPLRVARAYNSKKKLEASGEYIEKSKQVAAIKDWLRKHIVNVPVEEWDQGHQSPNSKVMVYQSRRYQRPLRNKFKFDDHGLVLCPTADELTKNFDNYYSTIEEAEELYHYLQEKLNLPKA